MNSSKAALRLAAAIFGLMCVGHVVRLLAHVDVHIGSHDIPMWLSVVAVIVAGALSLWMWRLSTNR